MKVQICLTSVLRVADSKRAPGDLVFKQVFLVKEEDDGGENEPFIVADGVEQLHAFMHAVLWRTAELNLLQTIFPYRWFSYVTE